MRFRGMINGLVSTTLTIVFLIWISIVIVNGDPLWFLRTFEPRADELRIYWDGRQITLLPGDPGYEAVMDAFSDGVGHWSGYDKDVVLSPESLARMRGEWRMLEVRYQEPVQVHIHSYYPPARNFYVPFSGAHFRGRRVFAALNEVPKRSGALNLDETRYERLEEAVTRAVNSQP